MFGVIANNDVFACVFIAPPGKVRGRGPARQCDCRGYQHQADYCSSDGAEAIQRYKLNTPDNSRFQVLQARVKTKYL